MTNPGSLAEIKRGKAVGNVQAIILQRWSPRAFSEKLVSSEDLVSVFEAATWAASSYNEQPWRFLLGRRGDVSYDRILSTLIEFNQSWAKSAPVLVLSIAASNFAGNGKPNGAAVHDLGAATGYLALQATALGMHAHSMAGLDKDKAREIFGIPAEFEVGFVTALGYLGDPEALPEKMRVQELAPRSRKPLSEVVFTVWGEPAEL